ncbi:MAG: flagellar hook capping FlgD N-terminal domain-containing protein [Acidobacteriota bacterium]
MDSINGFASIDDLTREPSTPTSTVTDLADEDVFLQLLVTQLANQDPLNPADGTEYVSQLATFSSLEQLTDISDGVENLVGQLGSLDDLGSLDEQLAPLGELAGLRAQLDRIVAVLEGEPAAEPTPSFLPPTDQPAS